MKFQTVLASTVAHLDSNVITGGGTDDTAALQAVLDQAGEENGVRLIMDGAALVSQLKVNTNTVIECLSKDCGFYQRDHSDCAIVSNYDMQMEEIRIRNISLLGGTYNQNSRNQVHHRDIRPGEEKIVATAADEGGEATAKPEKWIFAMEFYGVKDVLIRDVTVIDQRTFGITFGCFKNVTIENVWFDLQHPLDGNQDCLHFWGPGQFLTVKNVGGGAGDDFMNIGSDELNCLATSSITDVLVDGVFLDHADQGIRLLSRGKGRLDRITIRNVTGTYNVFGFYITPWFPNDGYGNFGDILIENVSLTAADEPRYNYRKPMLFAIGGNHDCLQLKNIRHMNSQDNRTLFEIGVPAFRNVPPEHPELMHMKNIMIDGLTILEEDAKEGLNAIELYANVENLSVKNVTVRRHGEKAPEGCFIDVKESGSADLLMLKDAYIEGFKTVLSGEDKVARLVTSDVIVEK